MKVEPKEGDRIPIVLSNALVERACIVSAPYPVKTSTEFVEKRRVSVETEMNRAEMMSRDLRAYTMASG